MSPQEAVAASKKAKLPNWMLAAVIGGGAFGVYYYMLNSVGGNLDKELEKESARQASAAEGR